jgi:hypothetical protein
MTGNDPLVAAQRAAERYWNVDGIAEIYVGCLFLLVPVLTFCSEHLPYGPLWFGLGFPIALMGGIAIGRPVIVAIRRRLTYPRTGYVAIRRRPTDAAGIALTLVALAAIAVLIATKGDWSAGVYAATGLISGVINIHLARSMGLARFYFLGIVSIAAGAALALADPRVPLGMSLLWGVVGVSCVMTGGITLRRYLRTNPAPPPEQA